MLKDCFPWKDDDSINELMMAAEKDHGSITNGFQHRALFVEVSFSRNRNYSYCSNPLVTFGYIVKNTDRLKHTLLEFIEYQRVPRENCVPFAWLL